MTQHEYQYEAEVGVGKGKLILGLILALGATVVFFRYFGAETTGVSFGSVLALLICVGIFTIGVLMMASAAVTKHSWKVVMTPIIAILCIAFAMNYVRLSGIDEIVSSYPMLKQRDADARGEIKGLRNKLDQIQKERDFLVASVMLKDAQLALYKGGSFEDSQKLIERATVMLEKYDYSGKESLIALNADLQRIPPDIPSRMKSVDRLIEDFYKGISTPE